MSTKNNGTWIRNLLENRQMVPRWHSSSEAISSGERNSAINCVGGIEVSPKWAGVLRMQSERVGDEHAKIELAELNFIGDPHVTVVVEDVPINTRSSWAKSSALGELWRNSNFNHGIDRVAREGTRLREIRKGLRDHPKQPFMWAELARSQLILGADSDARKSMACAIQMAPNSVFLRRCAARMHLHFEDVDTALSVIRKHPAAKSDPRLVSAEIAVSYVANRSSRYAHLASRIVDEERFRAQHRSEVAAAIATVELENGKHKKARALFSKSLHQPSENTLAQVQWASERDSKIIIPDDAWKTPCSHEADAMASRMKRDWESFLSACELWLESEPFASKPAELGSFVGYTQKQNERAHILATHALHMNHGNTVLLNNRAVASVYLGRIEDAIDDVETALKYDSTRDASLDTHLVATVGLIAYRLGLPDLGEKCYGTAVAKFVKCKSRDSVLLACLYWVREIARYNPEQARADFEFIKKNSSKMLSGRRDPEVESMLDIVGSEVEQGVLLVPPSVAGDYERVNEIFDRFSIEPEVLSIRSRFLEEII